MKSIGVFLRALVAPRLLSRREAHILNPDHLPNLIEPRALALVSALENCGAYVFASCAGHGRRWWQHELQWPHFAFRLDLLMAEELAACLHENTELNYRWWIVGHFVRRLDFTIAYALTIRDSRRFDMTLVDADLHWLAQHIQNNLISRAATSESANTVQILAGKEIGFDSGIHRHSEQKP